MGKDTTVSFSDPAFHDTLSDLVREGARRIIREAVESELDDFLADHAAARDGAGRRAVVRNGHQPERAVLTGVGPVSVRLPKTRDRGGAGRCFRSELLPPYLKKTRRLDAVIPRLYLKGISTNDFDEALRALFGESVRGLSPATVTRLKQGWEAEYAAWRARDWRGHELGGWGLRGRARRRAALHAGCDWPRRTRAQALSGARGRFSRVGRELAGGVVEPAGPRRGAPPGWRSGTVRSASGRRCRGSGPRRANSAAGYTRRRTCSTSCRKAGTAWRRPPCTRSGKSTAGRMRKRRSTDSSPPARTSIRRRRTAWRRTARRCCRSTTFRPPTGNMFAPRTQSNRRSPRSACGHERPGTA